MTTMRVLATVAMVSWVATHVDLSELRVLGWGPHALGWLVAAAAVTLVGVVLSALRWQRVLLALDAPNRLPVLVGHYLAGSFVSNFLPSTIGGDVVRVSRLSATTPAPQALASVVLERLTGWLVLPVLTVVALMANPGLGRVARGPVRTAFGVAALTVALLAVILAVVWSAQFGRWLDRTHGWRRFTGAIHLGVGRLSQRPWRVFEVLTVGFAYQLTIVLAAFLAAKAVGIGVGWTAMLAFFPVVAIVQVLPLTMSGLGTREAALIFFLHPLGVPPAHAFALGLLVYLVTVGVSLLGAPAFALGVRAPAPWHEA